jgi:nucleoid-associated protein YgaU
MSYPLQALLSMGAIPSVSFPTDSRYHGFSTLSYTPPDGVTVSYLARRYVPQPGAQNFATVARHTVVHGDRLDLLAAKYLGDPLLYWLICDANGAIAPDRLVQTPGTVLNITMPQGVPGGTSAQ